MHEFTRRTVLLAGTAAAAASQLPGRSFAQTLPGLPPSNAYLAADTGKSSIHFDCANSDATPHPAWLGTQSVKPEQVHYVPGNVVNVGYVFKRYPDGSEALLYSGPASVGKVRYDRSRFETIDVLVYPGSEKAYIAPDEMRRGLEAMDAAGADEAKVLSTFNELLKKGQGGSSGMYTLLDRDGFYYLPHGTKMLKIADQRPGDITSPLKIEAQIDVKERLPAAQAEAFTHILGTNLTYDGFIAVAMPGVIGITDRDFKNFWHVAIPDESVENGIAVDDKGGIYVVTSKQMRKVVWTGSKLSLDEADGAWASPYDIGPHKLQSVSNGSGATPTLVGFGDDADRLVLIPDAADPVKIVALWRDEIPKDFQQKPGTSSRRIADQIALTIPAIGTVEWSLHAYGYGTLAMNSTFPDPVRVPGETGTDWLFRTLLTMADTRKGPRGVEKFEWNRSTRKFERRWRNDAQLQWGLHPVSSSSNTVHLAAHEDGVFKLIGLDWDSGKQVADIALGASRKFNVAGGFIQPLPSGDLFVSGYFGPVLVRKKTT
jgi:hypothetical protein